MHVMADTTRNSLSDSQVHGSMGPTMITVLILSWRNKRMIHPYMYEHNLDTTAACENGDSTHSSPNIT